MFEKEGLDLCLVLRTIYEIFGHRAELGQAVHLSQDPAELIEFGFTTLHKVDTNMLNAHYKKNMELMII